MRGLTDRLYGDIQARWRAGELDGARFERACRWRTQRLVQPLLVPVVAALAALDWLDRDRSLADHLERLVVWLIPWGVIALAVGVRVDRAASHGAFDRVLRRHRAEAERDALVAPPPEGAEEPPVLPYGRYPTAVGFANRLLALTSGCTLAFGLGAWVHPNLVVPVLAFVPLVLWSILLRLDRRIHVEISPRGVWCREWGPRPLPLGLFKAAYAREKPLQLGVALVPHAPATLTPYLSWWARQRVASGDYVTAHAGTLALWTTRVGLDRDAVLAGLREAIAASRRGGRRSRRRSAPGPGRPDGAATTARR